MKKAVFFFLVFVVVLFLVANAMQPEIKYPAGKDTKESFGDGTYQIATIHASSGYYEILYNCEYRTRIIPYVEQFCLTKERAYIIGNCSRNVVDGENVIKYTYELYVAIELRTNQLTLCVIPNSSSAPDMDIAYLDEMIKNGDLRLVSQLTDFSEADQSVFEELDHLQN